MAGDNVVYIDGISMCIIFESSLLLSRCTYFFISYILISSVGISFSQKVRPRI